MGGWVGTWAPSMMAFIPDAQTLLMVVAIVFTGRPAAMEAWRAGACPIAALTWVGRWVGGWVDG